MTVRERKYLGRFTLQFNVEDPQQRTAAEILGQQGRRKAQFLTSAILQYIKHPNGPDQLTASNGIDMSVLKLMMLEILQSDPQFSSGIRKEQEREPSGSEVQAIAWGEPVSDSVLSAMSNTLAAFRGK